MFSYAIMFSVEDLSREIVDLAAHLDAATHRLSDLHPAIRRGQW